MARYRFLLGGLPIGLDQARRLLTYRAKAPESKLCKSASGCPTNSLSNNVCGDFE